MQKRCLQYLAFFILILSAEIAFSQPDLHIQQNSPTALRAVWRADSSATPGGVMLKSAIGAPRAKPVSKLLLLPPVGEPKLSVTPHNLHFPALSDAVIAGISLPNQFAEIQEIGIWRGFRLARLQINPLVRDSFGRLQAADQIAVQLDFPADPNSRQISAITPAERLVLKHVLNPKQASFWRKTTSKYDLPASKLATADTPCLRIEVIETGMYRLSYEEIEAAFGALDGIDPANLQLFDRETELALHIDGDADAQFEPGEAVWFWAERRSGVNSEWFDAATDVKALQLYFGQAAGQRFQARTVRDSLTLPVSSYFAESIHFEQDLIYYSGDDDADIFNSARIPGEGWIWSTINGNDQFVTTLEVPAVAANAPLCSLRARIRGITRDAIKPNHHVQIFLNETFITERRFADREDLILRAAFPAEALKSGANELRVVSVGGTGAAIDLVYFDWLELEYWRQFDAQDGQLHFRSNGPGTRRFHIAGLPDDSVFVFDLTTSTRLGEYAVSTENDGRTSIHFSETSDTMRQYVAGTQATLKQVAGIARVSPGTLLDTNQYADLLVITHADFRAQAERLAAYRRQNSALQVAVIDVREIYDAFDYGHVSEYAIQTFLRYAAQNWQKPAPEFVLLFGDGSWDPKRNHPASNKQNFVPTYGNPVSDNRLACIDGPDDFLADYFIGRLAVETAAEADAVVEKIMRYEQMPTQDWAKDFTFLNGGVNAFEQNLFLEISEEIIHDLIEPAPMAGKPTRIYKSSAGRTEGELLPDILATIDNGTSILAFSGHAGSQTWELMMVNEDVPKLNNLDRLPFIASMTCHTARFAEPAQDSFGEVYLRLPERGAIAFWGTSGWGFAFPDGLLLKSLFRAVTEDTVRNVGMATMMAKLGLLQADGGSQTNINLIDQYTLLGDPALSLNMPVQPDLTIFPNDIASTPATPTEQDSLVLLDVTVRNRGLASVDSSNLHVSARGLETGVRRFAQNIAIGPVGYAETVTIAWRDTARLGDFVIETQVDVENKISEFDEQNNAAQSVLHFAAAGLTLASPQRMQVLNTAQPLLAVYNIDSPGDGLRTYEFAIDTVSDFSSGFLLQSPELQEGEVRTTWQVPNALANGRLFWRARALRSGVADPWQPFSFYIDHNARASGFQQTGEDWRQSAGSFSVTNEGATLPRQLDHQLFESSGEIYSPVIGPAFVWQDLNIIQAVVTIDAGGDLSQAQTRIELWGRKRVGNGWQLLQRDVADNASLAGIDAAKFPFLQLRAMLTSGDSRVSPLLRSWRIDFEPMGDIVLPKTSFHVSADSLLQGAQLHVQSTLYFFGEHAPDSVAVALARQETDQSRTVLSQKKVQLVNGKAEIEFAWIGAEAGTQRYFLSADPDDDVPENTQFNNTISFGRTILRDAVPPRLEVLFDGRFVAETTAFVSPRPELRCTIFDDNPFAIRDTSQVQILIDGKRIFFSEGEAQPQFRLLNDGEKQAEVVLFPSLGAGKHIVTIAVDDAFGNRAEVAIEVQVASDLELLEVLNYPNPFARETQFTFILTQPADEVQIKIYTVAGRLIQTVDLVQAAAGFNAVAWNGRDADGDALANGIYLYKVIARQGQKQVESISKLAIAR